jgi:predicted transcriptional regulator
MTDYTPTDSELEILQLLWQHGECSVRQINDLLNQRRDVGYTTTLKIMQIMNDKGLVDRNADQRVHLYKARLKENKTKKNLLNDFIETAFNGSAQAMVMHALGNHKPSKQELEEIKEIINQLENK